MQQLYIPEIGEQITLAEDWSFTLMAEDRNQDLAAWAGYYKVGGFPVRFVDPNVVPPMRDRDHKIDRTRSDEAYQKATDASGLFTSRSKLWDDYNRIWQEENDTCSEEIKYLEDYRTWLANVNQFGLSEIPITLPAGTVLKVDRIYIRKGKKEYSSITFYAEGLGETTVLKASPWVRLHDTKKKKLRFWAKLQDCNMIKFMPAQ
jgi:hypothetical protein